jgi:hypothetical protein
VDGAEDQVILVQQRWAGEVLGAPRRVQGQLRQQLLRPPQPQVPNPPRLPADPHDGDRM